MTCQIQVILFYFTFFIMLSFSAFLFYRFIKLILGFTNEK